MKFKSKTIKQLSITLPSWPQLVNPKISKLQTDRSAFWNQYRLFDGTWLSLLLVSSGG